MGRNARRTVAILMAVSVCVIALVARIWVVNATAIMISKEEYGMGETVSLDGAFSEYKTENTDGYSLRVNAAHRMSIQEYLDTYAVSSPTEEATEEASYSIPDDVTDFQAKTLLVLDIEIINNKSQDDEKGYLDSLGWFIASTRHPERWIRVEGDLLQCSVPQTRGEFRLSIKPQTTYLLHVPFAAGRTNAPFPSPISDTFIPELDAGNYEFILTKAPVRKVVGFSVD